MSLNGKYPGADGEIYSENGNLLANLAAADGSAAAVFPGTVTFEGAVTAEVNQSIENSSPELELHNTTDEDADEGRESAIRFKGDQSGGEETTLALIKASHNGASDDEKGQLEFFVNDGSDGDSPTRYALIDDTGRFSFFTGEVDMWGGIVNLYKSSSPTFRIWSTQESDADGARVAILQFRGEKADSTVVVSGEITTEHDGASADDKGKMLFKVNDGNDGTSPTTAMTIHANGLVDASVAGVATLVSSADTSNPPTQAEMVSAFGAAAGTTGLVGVLDDAGGDANDYLVFSNGTSYWYLTATKGA